MGVFTENLAKARVLRGDIEELQRELSSSTDAQEVANLSAAINYKQALINQLPGEAQGESA